ncbi:MAG: DUF2332 domain-containing protein [Microbacteriaceae bacterium]|nr:DUF2332 domain-containing protein [Microbacteriaceae bacterium]HPZ35034.1 DUF2332 domain-containing protein [Microbacteriaceae bacterium]HQC93533.1 DUF2332 domain-containing protein [Microbacteriaceae bacterium]
MESEEAAVKARYRRFAEQEAPGRSALYEQWARGVAADPAARRVLARIPATHRQPPLVFAVARLLGAPLGPWPELREWMLGHADALVAECARRGVQTNEPRRCAALLPALSLIDGPIALLEVGASAGLCLFPDRYAYRYRDAGGALLAALDPADGSPVELACRLTGPVPRLRLPEVGWRAGIDLQPVDARDAAGRAWITGLVWPGETGREARIESALDVVATELERAELAARRPAAPGEAAAIPARIRQPLIQGGDAAELLAAVAAEAPADMTLVVTTPGVLAHVPWAARNRIIETARSLHGHWITIDAPGLHEAWHPPIAAGEWPADAFALALDGVPLAAVDPLGAWVAWRGEPAAPPTLEA